MASNISQADLDIILRAHGAQDTGGQIRMTAAELKNMGAAAAEANTKLKELGTFQSILTQEQFKVNQAWETFGKTAPPAANNLRLATAGVIREWIVLGHEAMTGNFSRMPGSLVVMTERMGGLHNITLQTIGAFAGAGAAVLVLGELAYQAYEMSKAIHETSEGLTAFGDSSFTIEQVSENFHALSINAGLARKEAEEFVSTIGRLAGMTPQGIDALSFIMPGLSRATGGNKQATEAIEAILNPMKLTASEARRIFKDFTQDELDAINRTKEVGDVQGRMAAGMAILDRHILGNIDARKQQVQIDQRYLAMSEMVEAGVDTQSAALDMNTQYILKARDAMREFLTANADNTEQDLHDTASEYNKVEYGIQLEMRLNKQKSAAIRTMVDESIALIRREDRERTQAYENDLRLWSADAALQHKVNTNWSHDLDAKVDAFMQANREIWRMEDETARERLRIQQHMVDTIANTETQLVSNILSGRMGLMNSLLRMTGQFIENEIAADLRYLTARMFFSDVELAHLERNNLGGFLFHTAMEEGKLAASAATTAGEMTLDEEGMVVSIATSKTAAASNIFDRAWEAMAGAYASISEIPVVGPFLAPAIAAGLFATVVGLAASLDTGTAYVPQDMLANIHKGEMVIPKPMADTMRDGGGMGGGSTVIIQALDSADVARWVGQNKRLIASAVADSQRFNPSTRPVW